jgi:hypothetical protein
MVPVFVNPNAKYDFNPKTKIAEREIVFIIFDELTPDNTTWAGREFVFPLPGYCMLSMLKPA